MIPMLRPLALLAACAALTACEYDSMQRATTASRRIDTASNLAPPIDCVALDQVSETQVRDDRTIDFVMADGRVLRNRLPNVCPGLNARRQFTYRTALTRLCNVDVITLNQNESTTGGCGLGRFQEVSLTAPAPAP